MNLRNNIIAMGLVVMTTISASAHDGKRLEIVVEDDQIFAQGYLFAANGNPVDDGGGIERDYLNAIHSHFTPVGNTGLYNNVTGFDLIDADPFDGADLVLTLMGAGKWANPPAQDGTLLAQDFGPPQLSPLDSTENIEVFFGGAVDPVVTTDTLGSFDLIDAVSGPVTDIDLLPLIDFDPTGSLYFLEWTLSAPGTMLADSGSIYTILSPPGATHFERLHFQSLALESEFGVQAAAVPEPSSMFALMLGTSLTLLRRKRG